MKVRNGFVSNSSSSSFVVKGYVIPNDKLDDIYKEFPKTFTEYKYQEKYDNLSDDDVYYETKEIQLWHEFNSEFLRDNGIWFAEYEEDGAPKNSIVVGELLQDISDDCGDYLHHQVLDCSETETLIDLKEKLKPIVGDIEFPVRIIVGTRSC